MKLIFQDIFRLLSSFEILLDDTKGSATLGTVLQEIRDNLINSNPKDFSLNKDFCPSLHLVTVLRVLNLSS